MKGFRLLSLLAILAIVHHSFGQTLQDIGGNIKAAPQVTIYTAKEIITMDPSKPKADAVAGAARAIPSPPPRCACA